MEFTNEHEYEFNECQSSLEELKIYEQPAEIQEQFFNFINNVPFIKWMVSKDRPHAKDLPRDKNGRVIFDITKPPILDDMGYFTQMAKRFKETGEYTSLTPHRNPNSEFRKLWDREIRRSWHGMLRESDGMWIPGDMYYYLNYFPIIQTKIKAGSKRGQRVIDFPECWDGVLLRYYYIYQAAHGGIFDQRGGRHGCEVSSRGKSKSYSMASMMEKRFLLGESEETQREVKCLAVAYIKDYLTKDGILNKFLDGFDFAAKNTPFPHGRLKNSLQDMSWILGYEDPVTKLRGGRLNEVNGMSIKDDPGKVRGKRQNLIVVEEFGSFPNVLETYNIMGPSVEEGEYAFGQMYLIGTSAEDASDFQGAQELVYNPDGYRMYALPNVYDLEGQGSRKKITFFFPGYLNRKGCYDKNGNSNVTKALLEILQNRYDKKYNSTDLNSVTRAIAEVPITPQEALIRVTGNNFPITQLTERVNEIDNNTSFYDSVYVGTLISDENGTVSFSPTFDSPIRDFPTKDNKLKGALEIYEMPQKTGNVVPSERYIAGLDPVNNDQADTASLISFFIFDLLTDRIVAEYTGRSDFADDAYELLRKACIFYNAKCLYENNIKGPFAYFSSRRSLHLLADTPEYLIDKQVVKTRGFGNTAKGVGATGPVNNFADRMIRDWLLKPVTIVVIEDGEEVEKIVPNLAFIKNRALLKELIAYNKDDNFDRVRALGMVMLYRGEFIERYEGDLSKVGETYNDTEDPYFQEYDELMAKYEKD